MIERAWLQAPGPRTTLESGARGSTGSLNQATIPPLVEGFGPRRIGRSLVLLLALCLGPRSALAGMPGTATIARSSTATATPTTAPPAQIAPGPPPEEAVRVTYQGLDSPLQFQVEVQGKQPKIRAKEAGDALTAALERPSVAPGTALADIEVSGSTAVVRVRGMVVTKLVQEDAEAAGLTLAAYANRLEGELLAFVPEQLNRRTLQSFVLHLFFSVFLVVLALATLRFVRRAFDRWDAAVESRSQQAPITLFEVPVFSPEAAGGMLAFGLVLGRVTAYAVTVLGTLAAILSQFDATRPMLRRIAAGSGEPLVRAAEGLLRAVPGLVLAGGIVIAVSAALRVINVLLDGIAGSRMHTGKLTPARVPVVRAVANTVLVAVVAPLAIAAAVGGLGAPLETIAVMAAGALALAAVPAGASVIVGLAFGWRQVLREGDWVELGGVVGEVTQVNLHEIRVVPEGGDTVIIPMLHLVFHPLRHLRGRPEWSLELDLVPKGTSKEILNRLLELARSLSPEGRAEAISLARGSIRIAITVPAPMRARLLLELSERIERGELELAGSMTMAEGPPTPSPTS